jgi:hypothetical protein
MAAWWTELLERFCARLASNVTLWRCRACLNPELKIVFKSAGRFKGNTVVSSLTVIPSLSSSEEHELFQKFIRTSTTLSTFSLMAKIFGTDDGVEADVMKAYLEAVKING